MEDLTRWTWEELEHQERVLSGEIQLIDQQMAELRARMRALQAEADPIRLEMERRRREHADQNPNTQNIGL